MNNVYMYIVCNFLKKKYKKMDKMYKKILIN